MNALDTFHTTTAKIAAANNIDFSTAQGVLFDRMMTERPEMARTLFNALMAEMAQA